MDRRLFCFHENPYNTQYTSTNECDNSRKLTSYLSWFLGVISGRVHVVFRNDRGRLFRRHVSQPVFQTVPRPLTVRVQRARIVHVRLDSLHFQEAHVVGSRRHGRGAGRTGHGVQRKRHGHEQRPCGRRALIAAECARHNVVNSHVVVPTTTIARRKLRTSVKIICKT